MKRYQISYIEALCFWIGLTIGLIERSKWCILGLCAVVAVVHFTR